MSALSTVETLVEEALGFVPATATAGTVAGVTITLAGVQDAASFAVAVATKLSSLVSTAPTFDADADFAIWLAQQLASDGIPYAGDAALFLSILQWVIDHNIATTQGTPITPAHEEAGR